MKRIFIDTNVLLDVMMKRQGYVASHAVLSLSEERAVTGYVSQGSVYTCLYVVRHELGAEESRLRMMALMAIVRVAACSSNQSFKALQSEFKDPEDALQHYTALSAGAEAIITRNTRDFKRSNLPVFTPEQFLSK